jgi:hypothetical protein
MIEPEIDFDNLEISFSCASSYPYARRDWQTDKYFIEKLRYLQKNYNQKMVFGFVLPPQSSWGESDPRITSGRAAMLEVLNTDEYAVPFCDMWKESGICLDQMTDGIHVASIESNNLYYHAMRRFLMGL